MSPTVSTWEEYYRAASRRRRAAGHRDLRVEKRRRRMRERIGIGLAAMVVGALTMVFYLLLR